MAIACRGDAIRPDPGSARRANTHPSRAARTKASETVAGDTAANSIDRDAPVHATPSSAESRRNLRRGIATPPVTCQHETRIPRLSSDPCRAGGRQVVAKSHLVTVALRSPPGQGFRRPRADPAHPPALSQPRLSLSRQPDDPRRRATLHRQPCPPASRPARSSRRGPPQGGKVTRAAP
jgi:hypothetical protein